MQSCLTLCNPMDHSPPGSFVYGISHARLLEWAAISFSKEIFLDQWCNPNLLHWSWIFYSWATRKAHSKYCCSVAQSYPALCGSLDWNTPGFPVLHHLPELAKLMSIELDCKEIKLVNPKENQSWIFIGGTMLRLKLQYLDHLIRRADSSIWFWYWACGNVHM